MKRVLVVQPNLQPPGGAQSVAAWALQALRDYYDLSLLTWEPVDLDAVNLFYGTSLRYSDFKLEGVSLLARKTVNVPLVSLIRFRAALLQRTVRKLHKTNCYHVLISTENEFDFGTRGIQYVNWPFAFLARPGRELRWFHRVPGALAAYCFLTEQAGGFSLGRMRDNLTLVSSDYVGETVRQVHGIRPTVVPPPVSGRFQVIPWQDRRDCFICLGRFSPEKEVETAIQVLSAVRKKYARASLALIGTFDSAPAYKRQIEKLIARNSDWISVHDNPSRDTLVELIPRCRFGIHPMENEHFGLAVAEMQRAGSIVFVRDKGGPAEIVGRNEHQLFRTPEEAVAKILSVLRNPSLQSSLREAASERSNLYTTERFAASLRGIVETFGAGTRQ